MNLQNKRALVTGADGFIGSRLVEQLVAAGAQKLAPSLYNTFSDRGWIEDRPSAGSRVGSERRHSRPLLLQELVRCIKIVLHLAALIPIPYSYKAPAS